MPRARVIVYARGEQVEEQLDACQQLCARRGYAVVALARDAPGQTRGWDDAQQMLRDDAADRVVVASGSNVPDTLESATGGLPGPAETRHLRSASHRIRPRPRPGGAA